MSWNINWAFGDGGDVEDLVDTAARYKFFLHSKDNKWYEECARCKGKEGNNDCAICDGKGYLHEEPGKTDEEMWEYITSRREDYD